MRRVKPAPANRKLDKAAPVSFAVFTLLGVIFIVLAKIFGAPPILAAATPVALMLLYGLLVLSLRRLRLRDDQTGDNFYYMGFIFTLSSLGVALYQYSSGGGVDDIIRNFGVAVASTIAGVILRILFNQLRRDPIEFEQASRLELAEVAHRVRRELDSVQFEIAHFRRTNQQMAMEAFHETQKLIADLGTTASTAVDEMKIAASSDLNQMASQIVNALSLSRIKEQLEQNVSSLDRFNRDLDSAGQKLAEAANGYVDRFASMQTPERVVEVRLQPAIDDLQRTIADAFERLAVSLNALQRIPHEIKNLAEKQEKLTFELSRLSEASREPAEAHSPQRSGFRRIFGLREAKADDGYEHEVNAPSAVGRNGEP